MPPGKSAGQSACNTHTLDARLRHTPRAGREAHEIVPLQQTAGPEKLCNFLANQPAVRAKINKTGLGTHADKKLVARTGEKTQKLQTVCVWWPGRARKLVPQINARLRNK